MHCGTHSTPRFLTRNRGSAEASILKQGKQHRGELRGTHSKVAHLHLDAQGARQEPQGKGGQQVSAELFCTKEGGLQEMLEKALSLDSTREGTNVYVLQFLVAVALSGFRS